MPSGPASSPSRPTGLLAEADAWCDHRQAVDGIAAKYRTGSPWRELPAEFGSPRTMVAALLAQADDTEDLSRAASVDSTVGRAHRHAAGARRRAPADEPADHASRWAPRPGWSWPSPDSERA
ncbi:transposase [Streptomyces pilosus]|uniref:transposase n=1 Tax=Streptomyces pilosus TaxID=28893 RepID=UPI003627483A